MGGGTGEAGQGFGFFSDLWQEGAFFRSFFNLFSIFCLFLFLLCFLSVFGSFWEVILGGFWDQVRFKTALEAISFEKGIFHEKI